MKIAFVRHLETEWTKLKQLCGSTDLSLSHREESLKNLQESLQKFSLMSFDEIVVSPLKRCVETFELSKFIVRHHIIDERIRELDLGVFEGRRFDSLNSDELDIWKNWRLSKRSDESSIQLESYESFSERIFDFIQGRKDKIGWNFLVFTHGIVMRFIHCEIVNNIKFNLSDLDKYKFSPGSLLSISL